MYKTCNCENLACEHVEQGKPCPNPSGNTRILDLGRVCDNCAKTYPQKYHVK